MARTGFACACLPYWSYAFKSSAWVSSCSSAGSSISSTWPSPLEMQTRRWGFPLATVYSAVLGVLVAAGGWYRASVVRPVTVGVRARVAESLVGGDTATASNSAQHLTVLGRTWTRSRRTGWAGQSRWGLAPRGSRGRCRRHRCRCGRRPQRLRCRRPGPRCTPCGQGSQR